MMQVYRSKRVVIVEGKNIRLGEIEYRLVTCLAMMDNRLTPYDYLLDVMRDGYLPTLMDTENLWKYMYRLTKKIGRQYLQAKKGYGYILQGRVIFIG